uniref:Uncharacterized protein n=1 Tax=Panagrellus redivivus TaxID=6233 RepID=A0A7E4VNQ2_PANRE
MPDFCPFLTPDVREALEFETEAYNVWKLAMHRNRQEYIEDRIRQKGGTIARASNEWRTGFTKAVKQHNEKHSSEVQKLFVKAMNSIMFTYNDSTTVDKDIQTDRLALDALKDPGVSDFKPTVDTADAQTQTPDDKMDLEDEYVDVEGISDSENEVSEQPRTSSVLPLFIDNNVLAMQSNQEREHQQNSTNFSAQLCNISAKTFDFQKNALNSRQMLIQNERERAEQLGIAQHLNFLPLPPSPHFRLPEAGSFNLLGQQPAAPVMVPQLQQPLPTTMLQNLSTLSMMPDNSGVLPNFGLAQLMMIQNSAPGFYVHPNGPQFNQT